MKLKVKRNFRYQADARTVREVVAGVYTVPGQLSRELADKILRFGRAEVVTEKVAPENKLAEVPENKAGVGRKSKRGRRAGAQPDD